MKSGPFYKKQKKEKKITNLVKAVEKGRDLPLSPFFFFCFGVWFVGVFPWKSDTGLFFQDAACQGSPVICRILPANRLSCLTEQLLASSSSHLVHWAVTHHKLSPVILSQQELALAPGAGTCCILAYCRRRLEGETAMDAAAALATI